MSMDQGSENVNIAEIRLEGYKKFLNLLRGRRANLQIKENLEQSLQSFYVDDVTFPKLLEQVDGLQAFVGHLMNVRKAVAALKTNCMLQSLDEATKRSKEVKEAIVEIAELSRAIVPYQSGYAYDQELYSLRLRYCKAFAQYADNLSRKRETLTGVENKALQERMNKANRIVKKLNVTRIITMMLIAAFTSDHEAYPEINGFRTSTRRDLVLEDFKESWDVGLEAMN